MSVRNPDAYVARIYLPKEDESNVKATFAEGHVAHHHPRQSGRRF